MPDIVGLGDSNIDLLIEVSHFARHDEKVRGNLLRKEPGGIIGNFCCAAARFGSSTGVVTVVGDDDFGDRCLDGYQEFGVETSALVVRKGQSTYFCVVLLDATGEKALTIVQTPLLMPRAEDVDLAYLRRARFVHLPSLDLEIARYTTQHLADDATKISIDIEPTSAGAGIDDWEDVLQHVETVFINGQSLPRFFGNNDRDRCARRLLKLGVGTVVITSGGHGGNVYTLLEAFSYPAFNVPVRDTTGAGDCFNAVFLSGVARGWNLHQSSRYAAAAAAMMIRQVGARTGLPTFHDVENFLLSASIA